MLAHEQVDPLLDEDTPFPELSYYAGAHDPDEQPRVRLITGIGPDSGVECMIIAISRRSKVARSTPPDTTVKQVRALDIAERKRLPMITLVESDGAGRPRQTDIFVPSRTFLELTRLTAAGIPTVSLVLGSFTCDAYVPGMSRYTVLVNLC